MLVDDVEPRSTAPWLSSAIAYVAAAILIIAAGGFILWAVAAVPIQ
jgi:hypothetical protein